MACRSFRDSQDREWTVWDVVPSRVERRREAGIAEWSGIERRKETEFRVLLGPEWTLGWLAFETLNEKRRLAPVPSDWFDKPAHDLEMLCQLAQPVRASRRLAK